MGELLNHLFGTCGDGHPSILYSLGIVPALLVFKDKIILCVKSFLIHLGLIRYPNKKQS